MSLLDQINRQYLDLHVAKEDTFWSQMMGLKDADAKAFHRNEIALKNFISDAGWIGKLRGALSNGVAGEEREGLEGWLRFFETNAIESAEARELQAKIVELEGALDAKRRQMELGYKDPASGASVRAGSVKLGLMVGTDKNEGLRRAALEGLGSIEGFVLENGFLDIVRERNRLGHLLGYEDYYDYKVQTNEGFSKKRLFELLDELEENTRAALERTMRTVVGAHGDGAREAWNFGYHTTGDLAHRKDPYLGFADSFERWVRSFAALGIGYGGARMTLDLVDRRGKYENGFMHGPGPAWVDRGTFRPARINFTANAVPGQVGSGNRALQTFFHEGGHAAHFSNIRKPAPCFAQEFAPTSVAFAETQSMFLDSIIGDTDWLTRYAKDSQGRPMPADLILESQLAGHRYRAHRLREMLAVSYFEKALYELPESDLQPERVLEIARDTERRMSGLNRGRRPLLSIPHLLSGDSSAYYHGYTLAQMAVYQTRAFFLERDGQLMDNAAIGPDLAKTYWAPGNSKGFLELVEDLCGKPFSSEATVALVERSEDEVRASHAKSLELEAKTPAFDGAVDLDATIAVIHGDETITDNTNRDLLAMAGDFRDWIHKLELDAR